MSDRALAGYRAAAAVARALPEPAALATAQMAGRIGALMSRERRQQVERNLRRVYGPGFGGLAMQRAVRRTFDSYARYYAESFRLPGMSVADIDAGLTHEGFEHIEKARADGFGPILAIPHLGGWEWAAFWVTTVMGIPLTAVVEALEPRELFDWFVDLRESLGMHVVPLGPAAVGEVVRAIKERHVICLLADRDVAGGGVEVEFFGERTTLPAGPATLALRTGAPLIPTAVYFTRHGHHGVVRPPIPTEREGRLRADVSRITQLMANELEVLIRRAPEQWHLMQPNWPSDRP